MNQFHPSISNAQLLCPQPENKFLCHLSTRFINYFHFLYFKVFPLNIRCKSTVVALTPGRMRNPAMGVMTGLIAIFLLLGGAATQDKDERANLKTIFDLIFSLGQGSNPANEGNGLYHPTRFNCPLCDSSVYSYCSDKLLHDACCCLNSLEHQLPPQCRYADCSFLHANSCREHKLITACCCSRLLKNNI